MRQLSHSQNFLHNPVFISSLIDKTNISKNDIVIEIGPGRGAITQELVKKVKCVIGIEIDPILAIKLRKSFSKYNNIKIIKKDFLDWELPSYCYKVFANIPFNTTSDIINKLTKSNNPPQDSFLIMQNEAAERFIGKPLSKDSQISIINKPFFEIKVATKINRDQFTPKPNVDIVLTHFKKRENPLIEHKLNKNFRDFVVYGYNQWQPTALTAFNKVFSKKQQNIISKKLSIENAKPSDLTIKQWLELFDTFNKHVPEDKKRIVQDSEKKLESIQKKIKKSHRTRL